MSKNILHGKAAREAILRGVDFLVDAVALTEGPRCRCCVLGQRAIGQSPRITRDGVTTANYADPSDPVEQMGADLIREACQKTDNTVGDGTTCTSVLARAMIHAGFKLIDEGANPLAMERGIQKATDAVINRLHKMAITSIDDEKVFQIATVSAHGDTYIGHLVADAVTKAGKDGVVTVEPSSTSDTSVESVAGLELEKSNLIHSAFITHPATMTAEWNDCRILLWEGVIGTARSLVPLLSQVKDAADKQNLTPLLIIAGGYEQEALAVIIKARIEISLPVVAVRMDAYGERRKEVMRDIAALIGGKAYTEDMGMKIDNVKLAELGQARKIVTSMSKTQIIEGKGNQAELAGRVSLIRTLMDAAPPAEKAILKKRLAALLGGITIIKVGGVTVTEMEEKKDRVVDAMSAAKAAVESGIVAGGGTALFRASAVLAKGSNTMSREERVGLAVVHEACQAVVKQIAENAGLDGNFLLTQLMATPDLGYNALTGVFENLIESGIIDPLAVVVESLRNAAAVSRSILTLGATISEKEKVANA